MTLSFQGILECEQAGGQETDVLGVGHLSLCHLRGSQKENSRSPETFRPTQGMASWKRSCSPLLVSGERHPLP